MAVVIPHGKGSRVVETGASELRERLLAGPASGCGRFTVRLLSLNPGGHTSGGDQNHAVFYFVAAGKVALSHDSGELDVLSTGDSAIAHAREKHALRNLFESACSVLKVTAQ